MDEEYDIMPHSAFSKLKKEVEDLKKSPTTEGMLKSMDNLNQSISNMMELFKAAGEEMKIEQRQTETFNEQVKPLMDKLDKVIDQNQKIAKGMVAIADMVNEAIPRLEEKVEMMGLAKPMVPPPSNMPGPVPRQMPRQMPKEMPMPQMQQAPQFPPMPDEEPDFGEPDFNEPDFGMPPSQRGPMMPPPGMPGPGPMPPPQRGPMMPAPPRMPGPGPMPPPGMSGMSPPGMPGSMPPPPPRFEEKKKKGLLGMFRK